MKNKKPVNKETYNVMSNTPMTSPWFPSDSNQQQVILGRNIVKMSKEELKNTISINLTTANYEKPDRNAYLETNQVERYDEHLISLSEVDLILDDGREESDSESEIIIDEIVDQIPPPAEGLGYIERVMQKTQRVSEIAPAETPPIEHLLTNEQSKSLPQEIEDKSIRPTAASIEQELTNLELERSRIVEPQFIHKGKGKLPQFESIIVGRKEEFSDYAIDDNPKVSAAHLKLFKDGDKWQIEDLNSSNGTRLNGVKLQPETPREIKFGDVISFVGETITFEESN